MNSAANTITVPLLLNTRRTANNEFHGPTIKQAAKLATYRHGLIAKARQAEATGQDERAFDLDCDAMDIEMDLRSFGFDVETGRKVRK